MSKKIRVQNLSGTPYEMGYAHGEAWKDDILAYTNARVDLVCKGQWSGGPVARDVVLDLAEKMIPDHDAYAPDLMAEIRGMADATGLSVAELIVVGGFTDFVDTVYAELGHGKNTQAASVDNCTAFLVPDSAAGGQGFFGQTWDMHESSEPYVVMLDIQPTDGVKSMVFTTFGCVGQFGMNEYGVSIGINNLMGADGQIGVTWPLVVRKALQQETAEDALQCVLDCKLAGAHNYLILDKHGSGYNVEAMSTTNIVTKLEDVPLVHTNHCLYPETNAVSQQRPTALQNSSEARRADGERLLSMRPVTVDDTLDLTRNPDHICHYSDPDWRVMTCGAAVMRPKSGELWAVWGVPYDNEYQRFVVR